MTSYDIHLSRNTNVNSDLQRLIQKLAEDEGVHTLTLEKVDSPTFLGLDLSAELAITLWKQLKANEVKSIIVPSMYREPLLTVDDALSYAKSIVEQKKKQDPSDEFGELYYVLEDIMWHTFRVFSEKMRVEKRSPGSFYINIDKIDGHLWKGVQEIMSITLNTWFY